MNLSLNIEADGVAAAAQATRQTLDGVPFKHVSNAALRQALGDDATSDALRFAIEQELLLREDQHRRALRDYDARRFAYREPHADRSDYA